MKKENFSVAGYVGVIVCSMLIALLIYWITNRITSKHIKRLKPDPIEKQKALELIDKQKDKVLFYIKLTQKYASIDFEEDRKNSPILATVLFKEVNKYLSIYNRPIEEKKLEIIKCIIKDESDKFICYEIVKNFFICLILDKNFDYKKYRELLFEIYSFEEYKDMDDIKKTMGIIGLENKFYTEYNHVKDIISQI
ncbi:hypothetical protein COBT_002155 [Conglomerata obtusa]